MKFLSLIFIFSLIFLLTGCVEEIVDDMFGWVPGYQSSSSSNSESSSLSDSSSSSSGGVSGDHVFQDGNYLVTTFNNDNSKPSGGFVEGIKSLFSGYRDDNDLEPNELDWNCDHIPNSVENSEGTCVCKSGYGDWYGQCVILQGSCQMDADCGGGKRSVCSGTTTKVSYRCDLTNNRCFPSVRVNCQTEYGSDYICSNGNCVSN